MTDTTVTPELLLWLAGKVQSKPADILEGLVWLRHGVAAWEKYEPHTDPAQFGRMVVWAWQNGVELSNDAAAGFMYVSQAGWNAGLFVSHDNTEPGIMSATVVAIARATGYEEPTHER